MLIKISISQQCNYLIYKKIYIYIVQKLWWIEILKIKLLEWKKKFKNLNNYCWNIYFNLYYLFISHVIHINKFFFSIFSAFYSRELSTNPSHTFNLVNLSWLTKDLRADLTHRVVYTCIYIRIHCDRGWKKCTSKKTWTLLDTWVFN